MQLDFHLLPAQVAQVVESYAQETFFNAAPVRVCVGGAFSVGKSSLLNMLLQKNILPSALEECTTLPTFLEYCDAKTYTLTTQDATLEISEQQFQEAIRHAPQGGQFVTLGLAQGWLKDIEILDMPGLGSMSQSSKDYSRLQLERTDIVLYLLAPRGPSQEDLDTLTMLHMHGKTVFLCVGHWDKVKESVRKGEALPNLKKWQADIAYKTGIDATIMPVSMYGDGRDALLVFLQEAGQKMLFLRKKRFIALAIPFLQNAKRENDAALEALAIKSEDLIQEKHAALMEEKNTLLTFKEKLLQERVAEQKKVMDAFTVKVEELQTSLKNVLQQDKKELVDVLSVDTYVFQGENALRQHLDDMAQYASYLAEKYGQDFTCPELEQFQIQIPDMESVPVTEFMDVGRVDFLRKQLHSVQEQLEKTSMAHTPEMQEQLIVLKQTLVDLQSERTEVMGFPLPKIEVENPSRGKGATMGRVVGEVADFALIWLLPNLMATKAISTTAKAASVVSKASKTAQVAKNVARVAQKLHNTAVTGKGAEQLPEIAHKLQFLDKITLGYWGEQLGRLLEGDTSSQWITDPECLQKQQEALRNLDKDMQNKRQELYRLEDALNLSHDQQKHYHVQKASLENELKELEQNAIEQQKKLDEDRIVQEKKAFVYAVEKSMSHWQSSFNAQSQSMSNLLVETMKHWWDEYIEIALTQHINSIEELSVFLEMAPQEKEGHERTLLAQRESIAAMLNTIEMSL